VNELDSISKVMDPVLNRSVYIHSLHDYIDLLKSVDVGKPAKDFAMEDSHGKKLRLSSLYGKYILLNFWASWSSPCRAENPSLVRLYKKLHSHGFDILGVSFDKDKKAWMEAIKKDHLPWNQVSDLTYWDNAAGKLYGIRNIPYNILLDKNGTILAKNIHGKLLQQKLAVLCDK
jgi:peroxiredoxin